MSRQSRNVALLEAVMRTKTSDTSSVNSVKPTTLTPPTSIQTADHVLTTEPPTSSSVTAAYSNVTPLTSNPVPPDTKGLAAMISPLPSRLNAPPLPTKR